MFIGIGIVVIASLALWSWCLLKAASDEDDRMGYD